VADDFTSRLQERISAEAGHLLRSVFKKGTTKLYLNDPTAHIGPWPPLLRFRDSSFFYGVGLLAPRPTPNLEDQVSVFMTPGDRVAQLYPGALGSSGASGVPFPVPTIVGT
jgi:hypothetical protein